MIVDGVIHCLNLDPSNYGHPRFSAPMAEGTHRSHIALSGSYAILDPGAYLKDWQIDETLDLAFSDTGIDAVVYHSLTMYDLFKDGFSAGSKGAEAVAKYGPRVIWYAGLDPFDPRKAREEARRYFEQGASGFKFLPARWEGVDNVPYDFSDRKEFYPIVEEIMRLGVRNIAVHKALPLGPAGPDSAALKDLWSLARDFPEVDFQIVHGGMAFETETASLLARFDNVYCTLETTWSLILRQPRRFAKVVGRILRDAGASKLIYADGCVYVHPALGLQRFQEFQIPADLQEGFGIPALTDEDKQLILGGNLIRLHDIDVADFQRRVAGDRFDQS
jgi:predicted TIM-barrel fold metal-dependent hydrolase